MLPPRAHVVHAGCVCPAGPNARDTHPHVLSDLKQRRRRATLPQPHIAAALHETAMWCGRRKRRHTRRLSTRWRQHKRSAQRGSPCPQALRARAIRRKGVVPDATPHQTMGHAKTRGVSRLVCLHTVLPEPVLAPHTRSWCTAYTRARATPSCAATPNKLVMRSQALLAPFTPLAPRHPPAAYCCSPLLTFSHSIPLTHARRPTATPHSCRQPASNARDNTASSRRNSVRTSRPCSHASRCHCRHSSAAGRAAVARERVQQRPHPRRTAEGRAARPPPRPPRATRSCTWPLHPPLARTPSAT
jgi:hypothetical protein